MSRRALTAAELATRLGQSIGAVERLLREALEDGLVEEVEPGRFALSVSADLEYGELLRDLEPRS